MSPTSRPSGEINPGVYLRWTSRSRLTKRNIKYAKTGVCLGGRFSDNSVSHPARQKAGKSRSPLSAL
jgi:hypothetical protein